MAIGRVDGFQGGIGDVCRKLLLLGICEQAVGLDTEHERWLLDERESVVQSRDRVQGLFVVSVRVAMARDVVGVEFAGDGDVAVGIEALDKLFALVAQVRLRREVVLGQGPGCRF